MALIDRTLAANPNHAQALTWRGSGRMFMAGQAFRRGATAEGMEPPYAKAAATHRADASSKTPLTCLGCH
jgi:hypothetical protein